MKTGWAARRLVLAILVIGFIAPILAGMFETLLPAFGHFPALGVFGFSLEPWRQLYNLPGLVTSLRLTLGVGLFSTLLSLVFATALCAALHGKPRGRLFEKLLTPILAAPHSAIALGLAFVIAPSGWISRLFSPWATGWNVPPDIATVHDQWGIALCLGLMIKEIPYFLFVMIGALHQVQAQPQLKAAQSLGYSVPMAWMKVILPQVYPQIRLSVYVILSYTLSVVDMAVILGPGSPPTLGVATMRWLVSSDSNQLLPATAAAVLQAVLVLGAIVAWKLAEILVLRLGRRWIWQGGRGARLVVAQQMTITLLLGLLALGSLGLVCLLAWSLAWQWPFPFISPAVWSFGNWARYFGDFGLPLRNTLVFGLSTAFLSTVLALAWLETGRNQPKSGVSLLFFAVYLPLLVPQIAFLYGLDVVMSKLSIGGSFGAVIWAQSLFVFPYVMIALRDPWQALDPRYARSASALGASPQRIMVAIKIPLLLRPILAASAVGFSVSVAQYLATLFIGEGRIVTLTTEAVTLASGADRRIAGVYGTLQTALPLLFYGMAISIPAMLFARRKSFSLSAR